MDIITEGSGPGLYISKEIVLLHGGQIFVKFIFLKINWVSKVFYR